MTELAPEAVLPVEPTPEVASAPERHLLKTGPVFGILSTADGVVYDVSQEWVEVASVEHAQDLAHQIGEKHRLNGHPFMKDEDGNQLPFVHDVDNSFKDSHTQEFALTSTTADNQALTALTGTVSSGTNVIAYASLHTGSPGTTGANECVDGPYARKAATWNAASAGSMTNASSMTFTTSGTTAMTYFGTFSALTVGTYGIGGALSSSVTATSITIAAGAITLSAA